MRYEDYFISLLFSYLPPQKNEGILYRHIHLPRIHLGPKGSSGLNRMEDDVVPVGLNVG